MKRSVILIVVSLLVLSGCKAGGSVSESPDPGSDVHIKKRAENVWWIWDDGDENPSRFLNKTCATEHRPIVSVAFGDDDAAEILVICGSEDSNAPTGSPSSTPDLGPPVTP